LCIIYVYTYKGDIHLKFKIFISLLIALLVLNQHPTNIQANNRQTNIIRRHNNGRVAERRVTTFHRNGNRASVTTTRYNVRGNITWRRIDDFYSNGRIERRRTRNQYATVNGSRVWVRQDDVRFANRSGERNANRTRRTLTYRTNPDNRTEQRIWVFNNRGQLRGNTATREIRRFTNNVISSRRRSTYDNNGNIIHQPWVYTNTQVNPTPPVQQTPTQPTQPTRPSSNAVRVNRVIDGDTIEVIYHGRSERVRLIGINAPESGQAGFNESTNFLRQLIQQSNNYIYMSTQGNNRDQFNRLRRCIFNLNNLSINQEMVHRGHARSDTRFGSC